MKNTFLGVVESSTSQIAQARKTVKGLARTFREEIAAAVKLAKPVISEGHLQLTAVSRATLDRFFTLAASLEMDEYDFVEDGIDLGGFSAADFRTYFRGIRAWAMATL